MIGWKMVDAEHADSVLSGSFRIGTFEAYKDLENGRADDLDASAIVNLHELWADNPEHADAMDRIGFHADLITGSVIRYVSPPLYALCFSRVGCRYDPSPDILKAQFEVRHLNYLASRLQELHPEKLGRWKIKRVRYLPRNYDALDKDIVSASPFIKDLAFTNEQEIRIVWEPKQDEALEPFCTVKDQLVSRLIRPV